MLHTIATKLAIHRFVLGRVRHVFTRITSAWACAHAGARETKLIITIKIQRLINYWNKLLEKSRLSQIEVIIL
jgi:hypothetical protein